MNGSTSPYCLTGKVLPNSDSANADDIEITSARGCRILVPANVLSTQITFVEVVKRGDTTELFQSNDKDGAQITQAITAGQAIAMHEDLFAADTIRIIWGSAADNGKHLYLSQKG